MPKLFRTVGDYISDLKRARKWLKETKANLRGYDAGAINRLLADWVTSSRTADEEIKASLSILRARSRDLCQNNDYGKKFLRLLEKNVIGPGGIKLQAKAMETKKARKS
jgi:capsid protein